MKLPSFLCVAALAACLLMYTKPALAQEDDSTEQAYIFTPSLSYEVCMVNGDTIICNFLYITDDYKFAEILLPDHSIRVLDARHIRSLRERTRAEWTGRLARKEQKRADRKRTRLQNPGIPRTFLKHHDPALLSPEPK